MARDYAKRGNSNNKGGKSRPAANKRKQNKKQDKGRIPGFVWLFCGLCLGVVVAAALYIFARPVEQPGIQTHRTTPLDKDTKASADKDSGDGKKDGKGGQQADQDEQEPRFEFYKMLPNYEVKIQDQDPASNQSQNTAPTFTEPDDYVVQVGSFDDFADADELRATIALLGIESNIHQAELANGNTVYRVRTVTIHDPDKLNHTLEKLHKNGVRTLVMTR